MITTQTLLKFILLHTLTSVMQVKQFSTRTKWNEHEASQAAYESEGEWGGRLLQKDTTKGDEMEFKRKHALKYQMEMCELPDIVIYIFFNCKTTRPWH